MGIIAFLNGWTVLFIKPQITRIGQGRNSKMLNWDIFILKTSFFLIMWLCEMRSARSPILGNPDRLQEYPSRTGKKNPDPEFLN